MKPKHTLKLLPLFLLARISCLSSEIVLPLFQGEYSGEEPDLFTMLTTSSDGTYYTLKGTVVFSNFQGKNIQKSGGAFCNREGKLTFSGSTPIANISFKNLHLDGLGSAVYSQSPVLFENLKLVHAENNTSRGGVIAAQHIEFDSNQGLSFVNNTSQDAGGAIYVYGSQNDSQEHSLAIKNHKGTVAFIHNTVGDIFDIWGNRSSSDLGGAIACREANSWMLFDNNQEILFQENAAYDGGAIYTAGSLAFSENRNTLAFTSNSAEGGDGGAIYAQKCHIYNQNAPVTFSGNYARGNGGAIYADYVEISGNSGPVLFESNNADHTGGAISTPHCHVIAFHDLWFTNNHAKNGGGAIFLSKAKEGPSTLRLEARYGNITFHGNHIGYSSNSRPNAIAFDSGAKEISLSARWGQHIRFDDPVCALSMGHNTPIHINKHEEEGYWNCEGSVIFANNNPLATSCKQAKQNTHWLMGYHIHLHDGVLAIENDTTLKVQDLTQTGGKVVLYPGANLYCTDTHLLSLKDISFGLDGGNQRIATIGIKESPYWYNRASLISLSGTPTIHDPQNSFYFNHDVASKPFYVEIQFAQGNDDTYQKTVNIMESLPLKPQTNEDPQYGYQGSWSFQWIKSALSPTVLRATWTPSGEYILPTHRHGELIPSSMWGTLAAIRLAHDAQADNFLNRGTLIPINHISLIGGSLTGVTKPDFSCNRRVYPVGCCPPSDYHSFLNTEHVGNFVGIKIPVSQDILICGSFTNMHGTCAVSSWGEDKDKSRTQGFIGNISAFKNWDALSFRASAFYTEETHNTQNINNNQFTKGSWKNQGWCGSAGFAYAYPKGIRYLQITPFADIEYIAVKQNPFLEVGEDPRYFASSYLCNLAVPAGVMLELRFFGTTYSLLMKAGMAYIKDIKRENPRTTATLVLNEHKWQVPSIAMGTEAINFKYHATLKYKALTAFVGLSSTQREGNLLTANASGGVSLSF